MKDFDAWARELADNLSEKEPKKLEPGTYAGRVEKVSVDEKGRIQVDVNLDGVNIQAVYKYDQHGNVNLNAGEFDYCYCDKPDCPHEHHEEECSCGAIGRVNYSSGTRDDPPDQYFCGGPHSGCCP